MSKYTNFFIKQVLTEYGRIGAAIGIPKYRDTAAKRVELLPMINASIKREYNKLKISDYNEKKEADNSMRIHYILSL